MRDILDALFKEIGIVVVTVFLMAIPILCGLSFVLRWAEGIIFLLCVLTFAETIVLLCALTSLSIAN